MTDERQRVIEVFDQAAATYDAVGVDLFRPIADRLVSELDPRPGERALDVGCGRGAALFPLARGVGPSGKVIGIDLSPRMVEATAADVAAAGLPAEVRLDDAQSPSLEPGSFDVVASSLVLFFLPDPAAALRAWHGLLVAGGRAGVSSFGPYSEHWKAVDEVFAPYRPPVMRDPRERPPDSPFSSDAGVERLFTEAGFHHVQTVTTTISVRFVGKDQWHDWTWSVGQRRMWMTVPEAERDAVRAQAYERLEGCRDEAGRIGFDQVVRFTLGRR